MAEGKVRRRPLCTAPRRGGRGERTNIDPSPPFTTTISHSTKTAEMDLYTVSHPVSPFVRV